jgi:hypothetical protein
MGITISTTVQLNWKFSFAINMTAQPGASAPGWKAAVRQGGRTGLRPV